MSNAQYIDISAFQSLSIDWNAYKKWSAQGDGVSRVALKSSEGTGFTDPHFHEYRAGALAAGIDVLIFYHYARPELNGAQAEADWQHKVVGDVRPQDLLMLDYEQVVPQANAGWALAWLQWQEQNYAGKLPTIYASDAYVRARLQDTRLARFPLTLANWTFNPSARPACPPPWKQYTFLQYTDKATNIPGVPGAVDANVFTGEGFMTTTIPTGWHEETVNGQARLVAPNSHYVVLGFRTWVLSHNWDAGNVPLEEEHAQSPLEAFFNQADNTGTQQVFQDSVLNYNASRGVYLIGVGNEFLGMRAEIATLKAHPPTQAQSASSALAKLAATLDSDASALSTLLGN